MHIAYDIEILPEGDPWVKLAEHTSEGFSEAGKYIVNQIPLCPCDRLIARLFKLILIYSETRS